MLIFTSHYRIPSYILLLLPILESQVNRPHPQRERRDKERLVYLVLILWMNVYSVLLGIADPAGNYLDPTLSASIAAYLSIIISHIHSHSLTIAQSFSLSLFPSFLHTLPDYLTLSYSLSLDSLSL